MTAYQMARYNRARNLMGFTAAESYQIATGRNPAPSVENVCWPTRQPGIFCESLMTYADMLRIRPQLYFPYSRRG